MCGGVRFAYDPRAESQLGEVYRAEQLERFRETGLVESLFWQARPILPALVGGEVRLFDWGNRDAATKLPKTGWVRVESLAEGKWAYLRPQHVTIPAIAGVEKKVWFGIAHGIRGILVRRGELERLYMLTQPPTDAFAALTGHDRMPVLVDQEQVARLSV
jgi:hypothetical protein